MKKKTKKSVKNLNEKDSHGQWAANQQQTKNPNGKRFVCAIIARQLQTSVPSGEEYFSHMLNLNEDKN